MKCASWVTGIPWAWIDREIVTHMSPLAIAPSAYHYHPPRGGRRPVRNGH